MLFSFLLIFYLFLLPSCFLVFQLQMKGQAWFHSGVSRVMCEAILTHKSAQPGDFMIRASESEPGHFALSVRLRGAASGSLPIKHHRIREVTGKYCISAGELYTSIVELVAAYMAKGSASDIFLARPARLLPLQCSKCGAQCLPDNSVCPSCTHSLISSDGNIASAGAGGGGLMRTDSIYGSVSKVCRRFSSSIFSLGGWQIVSNAIFLVVVGYPIASYRCTACTSCLSPIFLLSLSLSLSLPPPPFNPLYIYIYISPLPRHSCFLSFIVHSHLFTIPYGLCSPYGAIVVQC